MVISQRLEALHVDGEYVAHITVTNVPNKKFLAEMANYGGSTRTIILQLMSLDQAQGGTQTCNTGVYVKGANEGAVHVKLYAARNHKVSPIAENTTPYPQQN